MFHPCESVAKKTGIRRVAAPQSSLPDAPAAQGVRLAPKESVQWPWTHTANGSYVSEYTIMPRLAPSAVILSAAKNDKAGLCKSVFICVNLWLNKHG